MPFEVHAICKMQAFSEVEQLPTDITETWEPPDPIMFPTSLSVFFIRNSISSSSGRTLGLFQDMVTVNLSSHSYDSPVGGGYRSAGRDNKRRNYPQLFTIKA